MIKLYNVMNMAGFIYKLQNIINASPENDDTDIILARCLLKNIDSITHKTSRQDFANICYTSQSSISRFAQKIGYSSFNAFKSDCLNVQEELQELAIDNAAFQDIDFNKYTSDISHCLLQMQNDFPLSELDQICDFIHDAKRILIFATHIPGDLGNILQRGLLTTGKFVEFYPRKEHQMKIAKEIQKDDLCIFISLEGTLLMEKTITIPAIMSSSTSILITQNIHTKFSQHFTKVIGLGKHDHETIGKYKLLFFIDCLLHQYYHKYVIQHLK